MTTEEVRATLESFSKDEKEEFRFRLNELSKMSVGQIIAKTNKAGTYKMNGAIVVGNRRFTCVYVVVFTPKAQKRFKFTLTEFDEVNEDTFLKSRFKIMKNI